VIEFSPDSGAAIIPIDGRGLVWCELSTGRESEFLPKENRADIMRFDPSGKLLAMARGPRCELWRVADKSKLWSQTLSNRVSALAWTQDSAQISVASGRT
jgi:hypothetical protein